MDTIIEQAIGQAEALPRQACRLRQADGTRVNIQLGEAVPERSQSNRSVDL